MSIGSVIVRPTPTAAPLMAAMLGLRQLKMASMKPPPWRGVAASLPASPNSLSVSPKLPAPSEMSAPAQKARPAPVTTTTRTASSASARWKAAVISRPIWAV